MTIHLPQYVWLEAIHINFEMAMGVAARCSKASEDARAALSHATWRAAVLRDRMSAQTSTAEAAAIAAAVISDAENAAE